MIQAKHCDLCAHPQRDLQNGLSCGLTNKKPDFKVSCSDIEFSDSFKEYFPKLIDDLRELKKRRIPVYLNFAIFGMIGAFIIYASYQHLVSNLKEAFVPEFSYTNWKYFSLTLLIPFVGILLIMIGLKPLTRYNKELKKMKSDKENIEKVLNCYGIEMETLTNLK